MNIGRDPLLHERILIVFLYKKASAKPGGSWVAVYNSLALISYFFEFAEITPTPFSRRKP
jgi:hypothetical protein